MKKLRSVICAALSALLLLPCSRQGAVRNGRKKAKG